MIEVKFKWWPKEWPFCTLSFFSGFKSLASNKKNPVLNFRILFKYGGLRICLRNRRITRAYNTSHNFLYSLILIPSIPLLADSHACFAGLSWCWLYWCWSWLEVGQCWLYTDLINAYLTKTAYKILTSKKIFLKIWIVAL